METFLTCGEYYYQTKLNGKKGGTSLPALRGISLHSGGGEQLHAEDRVARRHPQTDFVDFAIAQFDGGLSSGVHLSHEDEGRDQESHRQGP